MLKYLPRHASEPRAFLSVADDAVGASTLLAHAYRNAASQAAAQAGPPQ